jgi:hypothetical protein
MLLWLGVAFMVVGLIVIWVLAIIDMFKRKDLKPWQIGLWIAAVVLFPILGVLAYMLFRPPADSVQYRGEQIQ